MFYIDSCPHTRIEMKQQFDEIAHLSLGEWSLVLHSILVCSSNNHRLVCEPLNWFYNPWTGYNPKCELFVCFLPASKKCKLHEVRKYVFALFTGIESTLNIFWANQYMKKKENTLMTKILLSLSFLFGYSCALK